MIDERTELQKYSDDRNLDIWSRFVAGQIIWAAILYLVFFVWS